MRNSNDYDDVTIQIRITEYAFISAIDEADYGRGWANVKMPHIAIIYVKCGNDMPDKTVITFEFPEKRKIAYTAENIFLQKLTREYIMENRLYPYIPFYITRYEKELVKQTVPDEAAADLEFFKKGIETDLNDGIISHSEVIILFGFVNKIIRHITNGNEIEERMVNIMGGKVLETLYDEAISKGREQGRELGIEQGITKGLQLRDRQKIEEMLKNGRKPQAIADFCGYPMELILEVEENMAVIGNQG